MTFVNLCTQRHLAQAILPALPVAGDAVYLHSLGYEVANCGWILQVDGVIEIVTTLWPQMDANGHYPFAIRRWPNLPPGRLQANLMPCGIEVTINTWEPVRFFTIVNCVKQIPLAPPSLWL